MDGLRQLAGAKHSASASPAMTETVPGDGTVMAQRMTSWLRAMQTKLELSPNMDCFYAVAKFIHHNPEWISLGKIALGTAVATADPAR